MTFRSIGDITANLAEKANERLDANAQAIIDDTLPVIMEWHEGKISNEQLFDITTPRERGICAMFLMFTEQYRPIMTKMLDAMVDIQEHYNRLVQTKHGIITTEELATQNGRILAGKVVFSAPAPTIRTRPPRDVPF